MGESGVFRAQELLEKNVPEPPAIVEGLIWERDNVFIVGHEKAGKSVLALQIALAITCGQPLFGEYSVVNPKLTLYVQTEGKLQETKSRLLRMMKVNDVDLTRLYIAYFPYLALDTLSGMELFRLHLNQLALKPEVIILDPLYHAMSGSLVDEHDSRKMTANLRQIADWYECTIIVVHHTHKPIRTLGGDVIDEGDGAIFGSFVWKAWADHTLLFKMDRSKARVLSCNTQRSGKVMESERLVLVDKPYLSFERFDDQARPYEIKVYQTIEKLGSVTREEIVQSAGVSMSAVEKSLRRMIQENLVVKTNSRPVRYSLLVRTGEAQKGTVE